MSFLESLNFSTVRSKKKLRVKPAGLSFWSVLHSGHCQVGAGILVKDWTQKLCPHRVIHTGGVKKSKHKEQSRSSASIFISQMLVIWVLFESILKLIMQFEFNSKYFFSSTGNFCMINLSLKTWTDDGRHRMAPCYRSIAIFLTVVIVWVVLYKC